MNFVFKNEEFCIENDEFCSLIRLRENVHSLEESFMDAAQKISLATSNHNPETVASTRVHKTNRSPHWVPHCYRRRYGDKTYSILDAFADHCFDHPTEGQAKTVSEPLISDAQHAITDLRRRIAELPFDLALLLSDGSANCNLNANFQRSFLLKMQKSWRISPVKR